MVILCAVLLLGNVSTVLGGSLADGSFMFRKWSADRLAEAQAIVTSQTIAGMILSGQQKFEDAPTSINSQELYLVLRVRALSRQSIWGDLECKVDQRSFITVSVPVPIAPVEGWVYYALSLKGAGINNPTVYVRWESIYAK